LGLRDFFRRKALSASPAVVEALQDRRINVFPALGGTNQRVTAAYQRGIDGSYGWIYATQPAVRSVIDFIARNTAQLGLKLYERVGDTERRRKEDHPAAETMRNPDGRTPPDAFIYRVVTDYLIWDNAYVLKFPGPSGRLHLIRLPPNMVQVAGGRFTPDVYNVWRYDGTVLPVPPEAMMHWFGFNPDDPLLGLSKLETLRQELATDRATQAALVELAKSGLKGGYIARPLEAPEWSQEDAERFAEQWRQAKKRGDGRDPVLEEGMTFEQTGVTPKDAQIIASREFTKAEVASVYGVPLAAMGGDGDTAEQRKLVYADVLPPITERLASQLDVDILRAEYDAEDFYFEFDLNEKLRGDLENRFPALTASAGRPWMTVNEIRSKENLPPIDDGDALTIPLNVMLAGEGSPALPAPNVMPPQDPNKPPQDGSHREQALKAVPGAVLADHRLPHFSERHKADMARQRRNVSEIQGLLLRFYQRQARHIGAHKGTFDADRWNDELSKDLQEIIERIIEREGATYVGRLGGDDFDTRQVAHYVEAMAKGTAEGLNRVTQQDLETGTGREAIERAMDQRAAIAGANIGARATVFARKEAAKQSPTPQFRMKTWIADTQRHAALDGVSVPLDSDWGGIEPGSEPNCACSVSIA